MSIAIGSIHGFMRCLISARFIARSYEIISLIALILEPKLFFGIVDVEGACRLEWNLLHLYYQMSLCKTLHIKYFAALAVLLASVEAVADEFSDEYLDSIFQLNEVEVTHNRRQEVITSQTLEGEQLEKLNSHSIADALRYFSGVQIKDFGGVGGIKTVNIRSLGSQNVGVFYDGIQLGNAQNGQVDLGRFSLDNIEEIAVYNGQKSNIFQGARDFGPAGTIYIRTRRPRWSGDEKTHLSAQFKAGSFGLLNPEITWEQRLSHTISLSSSVGYTKADGKYKFRYHKYMADGSVAYDTTATRQNSDIEAIRGEVSVFGFSSNGSWTGKLYYYGSERGIPGAIVNNVFRNGERQWDKNIFAQGAGEWLIVPFYQLKVNGKWAWDYTRFLRDDPRMVFVDNSYFQQELYLSAAHLFKVNSWWNLSLSTDFQWNKMNCNMRDFVYPVRYTEMVAAATSFSLLRFDAQAAILGNFIQDRMGNNRIPRKTVTRHSFTPSVFFSWQPLDGCKWRINGFFKRAFRMPTFNDLYYTDIGSKSLNPEMTTQYNIGSTYSIVFDKSIISGLSFKVDGYFNNVDDKIVAYPAGQMFRWTMVNLGKVDIWGLDAVVAADWSIGQVGGNVRVNYTFQQARDVTDRGDLYYGDQIPYVPLHSGTASLNVDWHNWNFNYNFVYTGEL